MAYIPTELYVTEVEQESYDLSAQLALPPHQVRSHVEARQTKHGKPYWVVVIESPEARDRAVACREKFFRNFA